MVVSEVGVSDGIVSKRMFEKGNGHVIKNEIGELVSGERSVGR